MESNEIKEPLEIDNILKNDSTEIKNFSFNSTQTSEKLLDFQEKNDEDNEKKINKTKKEKKDNMNFKLLGHKRLIRKSDLILQKQITKKIAKSYFDKEAELGSDNEEHDNIVKKVYNSDSDLEKQEDEGYIEDLIDDKNIINSFDNKEQNEKYITDMFIQDKEEVLKVIEGPQRKIQKIEKQKFDESDLPLKLRIERMNNEHIGEDDEIEEMNFKSLISKVKKIRKQFKEDNANEDLKAILKSYQDSALKKIEEMNKTKENELKKRMIEDNKILENVVLLNKKEEDKSDKKNKNNKNNKKNNLFIKGNGEKTNIKSNYSYKIGSFMNSTNSFLRNIQNNNQKGNNIKKSLEKNTNSNLNNFRMGNLSTLFLKKNN